MDGFRGSIRLSSARVLDSGDVEIIAHAEHRRDLERLIQTTAWHEEFERSLGPLPIQTYKVNMQNMKIGCMEIRNRKEKSGVVMTLLDTNFPVESDNGNCTITGDISWCGRDLGEKKEKKTTALTIEFLFPEHANKAILNGLHWQGQLHACNISHRHSFGLQRCENCLQYDHLRKTCSAEPRCSKCAGQHQEKDCTSTIIKCFLCGGSHRSRKCQAHMQANEDRRFFPISLEPPAIEPVAGIHTAIKKEPEQSKIMFDRAQKDRTTRATLSQQANDFRSVAMARDTGFQPDLSVRLKREAENALPETESGGDTKRIKQEDLKREDSLYREDSMAPYRQPSPFIIQRPD